MSEVLGIKTRKTKKHFVTIQGSQRFWFNPNCSDSSSYWWMFGRCYTYLDFSTIVQIVGKLKDEWQEKHSYSISYGIWKWKWLIEYNCYLSISQYLNISISSNIQKAFSLSQGRIQSGADPVRGGSSQGRIQTGADPGIFLTAAKVIKL